MTDKPTLIERLRAKDRAWQEQCDGWIAEVRKMGGEVTAEQEAVIRRTIYAEAADALPVPNWRAGFEAGKKAAALTPTQETDDAAVHQ